jgi:hypothetical protein
MLHDLCPRAIEDAATTGGYRTVRQLNHVVRAHTEACRRDAGARFRMANATRDFALFARLRPGAAMLLAGVLTACASAPPSVVIVQQPSPAAQLPAAATTAPPVPEPIVVRQPAPEPGDRLTRAQLEPWLTNILELHFVGIQGRSKKESFTRASVKDCAAHFETSTVDTENGDSAGLVRTVVASDLKDVVEVTAAAPNRIRIAGSASSTHMTVDPASAAAPENPDSVTIVLDNADGTRDIVAGLRNMVGLCGGVRPDSFR